MVFLFDECHIGMKSQMLRVLANYTFAVAAESIEFTERFGLRLRGWIKSGASEHARTDGYRTATARQHPIPAPRRREQRL
jgi:hypothetical protein